MLNKLFHLPLGVAYVALFLARYFLLLNILVVSALALFGYGEITVLQLVASGFGYIAAKDALKHVANQVKKCRKHGHFEQPATIDNNIPGSV